jgi:nucleotide-binding universal stress UspA family protein
MEDTLVTVAIQTYERALILKGMLESEGIEVALYNVNLIQPVVSAGVRVRIRECDLPAALGIIESVSFLKEGVGEIPHSRIILVPVDFSEFTLLAVRLAFNAAKTLHASVVILHTYYSPFYAGGYPIGDALIYSEQDSDAYRNMMNKNEEEMQSVMSNLRQDIANGILPDVPFVSKFREGVPEEQILMYAKKHQPLLLIMGTKGMTSNSHDILGNVAAEVIDRSPVPVFAFPENTPFERFEGIRTIGFMTRFDQQDLVVFERMMTLLSPLHYKVYFVHLSDELNVWNEVKLTGMMEYFKRQYPELETSYILMEEKHMIDNLNKLIQDRHIDLLTMASSKRTIFARLFNPSIARRMVFHSDTPLLVIHG